jgi:hypothetical protein
MRESGVEQFLHIQLGIVVELSVKLENFFMDFFG